jgi:hypothetical protein
MFTIAKRTEQPVRVTLVEAQGDEKGAAITLAPIDRGMRRRAMRAAKRLLEKMGVPAADGIEGDVMWDVSEEVSRELMRLGIVSIDGIFDESVDPPVLLALTPDRETRLRTANDVDRPLGTIDDLLADERVFGRLDDEYVVPDAMRRAEKNGLSGSPNGTSAAATPGNGTANFRARPPRKAGAKSARTKRTRSKRTPAKASGKR